MTFVYPHKQHIFHHVCFWHSTLLYRVFYITPDFSIILFVFWQFSTQCLWLTTPESNQNCKITRLWISDLHSIYYTQCTAMISHLFHVGCVQVNPSGLGGSVGCAVRLETRRSRVQSPPKSATFFRGDWSWNIFYGHSLPSADSRRAVVERMCTILVNCLEEYACPVNVWLGKLTELDMTQLGWLGRKTSTQTNKQVNPVIVEYTMRLQKFSITLVHVYNLWGIIV